MQWLTSEFRSSSAPPQGLPWDARLPGSLEISKAKQLLTLKLFGSAQQGNILPAPAEAEQGDVLCPEGLNSTFPPLYSQLFPQNLAPGNLGLWPQTAGRFQYGLVL